MQTNMQIYGKICNECCTLMENNVMNYANFNQLVPNCFEKTTPLKKCRDKYYKYQFHNNYEKNHHFYAINMQFYVFNTETMR